MEDQPPDPSRRVIQVENQRQQNYYEIIYRIMQGQLVNHTTLVARLESTDGDMLRNFRQYSQGTTMTKFYYTKNIIYIALAIKGHLDDVKIPPGRLYKEFFDQAIHYIGEELRENFVIKMVNLTTEQYFILENDDQKDQVNTVIVLFRDELSGQNTNQRIDKFKWIKEVINQEYKYRDQAFVIEQSIRVNLRGHMENFELYMKRFMIDQLKDYIVQFDLDRHRFIQTYPGQREWINNLFNDARKRIGYERYLDLTRFAQQQNQLSAQILNQQQFKEQINVLQNLWLQFIAQEHVLKRSYQNTVKFLDDILKSGTYDDDIQKQIRRQFKAIMDQLRSVDQNYDQQQQFYLSTISDRLANLYLEQQYYYPEVASRAGYIQFEDLQRIHTDGLKQLEEQGQSQQKRITFNTLFQSAQQQYTNNLQTLRLISRPLQYQFIDTMRLGLQSYRDQMTGLLEVYDQQTSIIETYEKNITKKQQKQLEKEAIKQQSQIDESQQELESGIQVQGEGFIERHGELKRRMKEAKDKQDEKYSFAINRISKSGSSYQIVQDRLMDKSKKLQQQLENTEDKQQIKQLERQLQQEQLKLSRNLEQMQQYDEQLVQYRNQLEINSQAQERQLFINQSQKDQIMELEAEINNLKKQQELLGDKDQGTVELLRQRQQRLQEQLQQSQEAYQKATDEFNNYQQEKRILIESLQRKNTDLQLKNIRNSNKIESLEATIQRVERQQTQIQINHDFLQQSYTQQVNAIRELQMKLKLPVIEYQEGQILDAQQIQQFTEELYAQINSMGEENRSIQTINTQYKLEIEQRNQQILELRIQIISLDNDKEMSISDRQNRIQDLQNRIQGLELNIQQLKQSNEQQVLQLQANIQIQGQTIQQQQQRLEEQQQIQQSKQQQIQQQNNKIQELQQQIQNVMKNEGRLEQQHAQIEQLQVEIQGLKNSNQTLQQQIEQQNISLQNQQLANTLKISELEQQIQRYEDQLREQNLTRQQVFEINEQLNQARTEINNLGDTNRQLNARIQEYQQQQIQQLQQMGQQQRQNADLLNQQNANLTQIRDLRQQIEEYKDQLQQGILTKQQNERVTDALNKATNEVQALEQTNRYLIEQIQQLQQDNALSQQIQQSELAAKQQQIQQQNNKIQELQQQIQNVIENEGRLEQQYAQVEQLQFQIQGLRDSNQTLQQQIGQQNMIIYEQQQQNINLQNQQITNTLKISELEQQIQYYGDQLREENLTREQIDQITEQLNQSRTEINNLEDSNKQLTEQIQNLQKQQDQQVQQNRQLSLRASDQDEQIQQLQQRIAQQQQENAQLQQDIQLSAQQIEAKDLEIQQRLEQYNQEVVQELKITVDRIKADNDREIEQYQGQINELETRRNQTVQVLQRQIDDQKEQMRKSQESEQKTLEQKERERQYYENQIANINKQLLEEQTKKQKRIDLLMAEQIDIKQKNESHIQEIMQKAYADMLQKDEELKKLEDEKQKWVEYSNQVWDQYQKALAVIQDLEVTTDQMRTDREILVDKAIADKAEILLLESKVNALESQDKTSLEIIQSRSKLIEEQVKKIAQMEENEINMIQILQIIADMDENFIVDDDLLLKVVGDEAQKTIKLVAEKYSATLGNLMKQIVLNEDRKLESELRQTQLLIEQQKQVHEGLRETDGTVITPENLILQVSQYVSFLKNHNIALNISQELILTLNLEDYIMEIDSFETLKNAIIRRLETSQIELTEEHRNYILLNYGISLNRDQPDNLVLKNRIKQNFKWVYRYSNKARINQFRQIARKIYTKFAGKKVDIDIDIEPDLSKFDENKTEKMQMRTEVQFVEGYEYDRNMDLLRTIPVANRVMLMYKPSFQLFKTIDKLPLEASVEYETPMCLYLGYEQNNLRFDQEEVEAIESIKYYCGLVSKLYKSYRDKPDGFNLSNSGILANYDKWVQKINRGFSRFMQRWMESYFYTQQNNVISIDHHIIGSQGAAELDRIDTIFSTVEDQILHINLEKEDQKKKKDMMKDAKRIKIPQRKQHAVFKSEWEIQKDEVLYQIRPYRRRADQNLNMVLDKGSAQYVFYELVEEFMFDEYSEVQVQYNSALLMLDNLTQSMLQQNMYGVQNKVLVINSKSRLGVPQERMQQTAEDYISQSIIDKNNLLKFDREYINKKIKLFQSSYNSGEEQNNDLFVFNEKGFEQDDILDQQCYRLSLNAAKYRSVTAASRNMICIITSMVRLLIASPLFNEKTRSVLNFIYNPQIKNEYYFNFQKNRKYTKEKDLIITNVYPLVQMLQICDQALIGKGLKLQDRNDFITSKVVSKNRDVGAETEYFIHSQKMIFMNMVQQTFKPIDRNISLMQIMDETSIKYYQQCIQTIVINHLFYRAHKSKTIFGQRRPPPRNQSIKTLYEYMEKDKRNLYPVKLEGRFVLEIRVNLILENLLQKTNTLFTRGMVGLEYIDQDDVLNVNKRSRLDTWKTNNAIFILFNLNNEYQQSIIEEEIEINDDYIKSVEGDIQLLTFWITNTLFQHLFNFHNDVRQQNYVNDVANTIFDNVKLFTNNIDFLKEMYPEEEFDIGERNYMRDGGLTDQNEDGMKFKSLFQHSEGFNISDLVFMNPELLNEEELAKAQQAYKQVQQLRISYVGFERFMICSPQKGDNGGQLKKVMNIAVNYKYFKFKLGIGENYIQTVQRQTGQGTTSAPDVVEGINFFMKDVWRKELPVELQELTDTVHKIFQSIYDMNCAVIVFLSLVYHLFPDEGMIGVNFKTYNMEEDMMINNVDALGLRKIFEKCLEILTISPERLFEQLTLFAEQVYKKEDIIYVRLPLIIEVFDHEKHVQHTQMEFPFYPRSWQQDPLETKYALILWKSHIELFSEKRNYDKMMKYLLNNNQKYISYAPENIRPITHEERVQHFQKKYNNKKHIIVSYDFETGIKGEMLPYMLVYSIDFYGLKQETVDLVTCSLRSLNDKAVEYMGVNFFCLTTRLKDCPSPERLCRNFVLQLQVIRNLVDKQVRIIVIAHNGGRFDHIILLKYIFEQWGHNVQIFGSLTNIKMIQVNSGISFYDSLQMTQLGSLNSACGSKGLDLKIQKLDLGETQHLDSWFDYQTSPDHEKLLRYCIHDVYMLHILIRKFNNVIIEMLQELYSVQNPQPLIQKNDVFMLSQSLSATSFEMFFNYLTNEQVSYITDYFVYHAVKRSQRGGYTDVKDYRKRFNVHDADINSSYPHQMRNYAYNLQMAQKPITLQKKYFEKVFERNYQNINQYSLYGLTYFDLGPTAIFGYIPIKCKKTGVLFYPQRWGDEETHFHYDVENDNCTEDEFLFRISSQKIYADKIIWVWGFQIATAMQLFHVSVQDEEQRMVLNINFEIEAIRTGRPFKIVEVMYEMRNKAKREGRQGLQLAYKLKMNGFSGQMGMKDYPKTAYFKQDLVTDCKKINHTDPEWFEQIDSAKQQIKNDLFRQFVRQFAEKHDIYNKNDLIDCINVDFIPGTEMVQMKLITHGQLPKNKKCLLAHVISQITAHGRDQLLVALYQFNRSGLLQPIYCDTDSIYGTCEQAQTITQELVDRFIKPLVLPIDYKTKQQIIYDFKIGTELGQWGFYDNPLNKPAKMMQVFGKKMYLTRFSEEDDPMQKHVQIKMKGSSKDMEQNLQIFKQFEELGYGIKNQVQWQRKQLQIKQVQIQKLFKINNYSVYVNEDGTTRPFLDQNEKIQFELKNNQQKNK